MTLRIAFVGESRLIGLPSLGLTALKSWLPVLISRLPSANSGIRGSTTLNGSSTGSPQMSPMKSDGGEIDKEDVYGFYREEARKNNELARNMAAQGADVPLPMDVRTNKTEHHYHGSGVRGWALAALLGAGMAGLISPDIRQVIGQWFTVEQPSTQHTTDNDTRYTIKPLPGGSE